MKILIIQQKMIGDVLTSSILFEALRHEFPESELHYLINEHTLPVVENNPFIDQYILITEEENSSNKAFIALTKKIQKEKYDAVIDVYCKISSIVIALFSKAKTKITFRKWYTNILFDQTIEKLKSPINNSSLAIENRMALLIPFNITFKQIKPKVYLTCSEKDWAKSFLIAKGLEVSQPIIMISALGSSKIKSYPYEYMAELIYNIRRYQPDAQLLFNYVPKQSSDAQRIYELCDPETRNRIYFDVFGNSLRQFLSILYYCDALVGNEGGAVNMAKALNKPTFIIFSPYLNIQNWLGTDELGRHVAVHLSEYIHYDASTTKKAKRNPEVYYMKFKPSFILPKLERFISSLPSK